MEDTKLLTHSTSPPSSYHSCDCGEKYGNEIDQFEISSSSSEERETDEKIDSQQKPSEREISCTHDFESEGMDMPNEWGVTCDFHLVDNIKKKLDEYIDKYKDPFHIFNEELLSFCQSQSRQTKESWRKKERLCEKIKENVAKDFPDMEVETHLFGSTVIGTGLRDADLDVSLSIRQRTNDDPSLCNTTEKNRQKLDKVGEVLRRTFSESSKRFKIFPHCKVPIIKMKFTKKDGSFNMDLNVNRPDGVFNSYLAHHYSLIDERFVQLCLLIKCWAKQHGLCDASIGMLSSHSYQLMVIHYLQCGVSSPILPNLQHLHPEIFNDQRHVDDVTLRSSTIIEPLQLPAMGKNDATIGELLIGFFDYFCDMPWESHAISIRRGTHIPRTKIQAKKKALIYIEEPYEAANAARNVRKVAKSERIVEAFGMAASLFSNTPPSFESFLKGEKRKVTKKNFQKFPKKKDKDSSQSNDAIYFGMTICGVEF